MPKTSVKCPVCKQEVTLTDLGELPKHGDKKPCAASRYTPKEASALVTYAAVRK